MSPARFIYSASTESSAIRNKRNRRGVTLTLAGLALGLLATGHSVADASTSPAGARPAPVSPASISHAKLSYAEITCAEITCARLSRAELSSAAAVGGGHADTAPGIRLVRHVAADHRARAPRQIARAMLPHFRWGQRQFRYLDRLWSHESGWNRYAANPYSGAYGIPQAMPGGQMASAGPGWRWNAHTQIRWGMRYIRARYGSPRRAWVHETGYGWY